MATSPAQSNQPSPLDIIDAFVIACVATIIVIRTTLSLLGYPRLGGEHFHIAHMLWGGFALTAALLISLLQRQANREILALLGGVGFGFFIDEIGKFVTKDNNYFYHGSFLLMYLSLLVIWLLSRILVARSQQQLLYLPATWPSRRIEQFFVVLWAVIQLVAMPLFVFDDVQTLNAWAVLQLACTLVFVVVLARGLWHLTQRRPDAAASALRVATFVAIVAVLPFLYYLNPEFALLNTLLSVMIMVGLSEVSFKQIVQRILRKSPASQDTR